MTTAPASDLKFSHSHTRNGCDDFFAPPRASATTFRGLAGADFCARLAMDRELVQRRRRPPRARRRLRLASIQQSSSGLRSAVPVPECKRGARHLTRPSLTVSGTTSYLMCLFTSFVISNIETL